MRPRTFHDQYGEASDGSLAPRASRAHVNVIVGTFVASGA